jgi:hypothetical protein
MVAKTTSNHAKPNAWIVSPKDKGRKSIKKGKVFLNNGDEFEIELFNPLTECVLADIKLNGQSISKTGLVIKPGQRFYLDCFVDDKKKFIFNTYEIETNLETIQATKNNGLLEVFFYKEDVITINNWRSRFDKVIVERWYPSNYPGYNPWWNPGIYCGSLTGNSNTTTGSGVSIGVSGLGTTTTSNAFYGTNSNGMIGGSVNAVVSNTTGTVDLTSLNAVYDSGYDNNMILCSSNTSGLSMKHETGRVEKGSSSSQKFTEIDMDFETNYISSTIIEILPESVKPLDVKKVKEKTKPSGSDEVIDLIKKLSELHTAGILTDEEFSSKKLELLSKI